MSMPKEIALEFDLDISKQPCGLIFDYSDTSRLFSERVKRRVSHITKIYFGTNYDDPTKAQAYMVAYDEDYKSTRTFVIADMWNVKKYTP